MHPHWGQHWNAWGPHNYWHRVRRGPSRILWFVIGSIATVWWIRRKDLKRLEDAGYFDNHRSHFCSHRSRIHGPPPGAPGVPVPPPGAEQAALMQQQRDADVGRLPFPPPPPVPTPAQQQQLPEPPATPWGGWDGASGWSWHAKWGKSPAEEDWEKEMAKLKQLAAQATDKMADMSEATLDSVLTAVEHLKSKLSEHRSDRERQSKILEEQARQLEEEKRLNPPRWV